MALGRRRLNGRRNLLALRGLRRRKHPTIKFKRRGLSAAWVDQDVKAMHNSRNFAFTEAQQMNRRGQGMR